MKLELPFKFLFWKDQQVGFKTVPDFIIKGINCTLFKVFDLMSLIPWFLKLVFSINNVMNSVVL